MQISNGMLQNWYKIYHPSPSTKEDISIAKRYAERARMLAEYNAAQAILFKEYDTELERLLKQYDNGQSHGVNGFDPVHERLLNKLTEDLRKLDWLLR
jgi:uncharacterized protein HemY